MKKLLVIALLGLTLQGCFIDSLCGTDDDDNKPNSYSYNRPGKGNSIGQDNTYGEEVKRHLILPVEIEPVK